MTKEDLNKANKIDELMEFAETISHHPDEISYEFSISDRVKAKYGTNEANTLMRDLLGTEYLNNLKKEFSNRLNNKIVQRFNELMSEFEHL